MLSILSFSNSFEPIVWRDNVISKLIEQKYSQMQVFDGELLNKQCPELKTQISLANGILIKFNKTFYIICNYHTIKNNYKIVGKIKNTEFELTHINDFYEYDLSIFQFTKPDLSITEYYNYTDLETKLPHNFSRTKCMLSYIDAKTTNKVNLNCSNKNTNIAHDNINTHIMSSFPLIRTKLETKSKIPLNGISGCPFISNNKLMGIVSNINVTTNEIDIIPNYLIKGIINMITKKKQSLYFPFYSNLVKINSSGEDKSGNICEHTIYGLYVTNDFSIKWKTYTKNNFIPSNKTIIEFDNHEITNEGKVYLDIIDNYINPSTYVNVKNMYTDTNSISLKYLSSTNQKVISKKIKLTPLETLCQINMKYNNSFFIYNGLVFVEFSDDIYRILLQLGISFSNDLINLIFNPFSDSENLNKKIIVIDTIKYSLSRELYDTYQNCNFPNLKDNNNCRIPVLKSINSNSIQNLDKLIEFISNNSDNKIKFTFDMGIHGSKDFNSFDISYN
jgi:hypothetical protein